LKARAQSSTLTEILEEYDPREMEVDEGLGCGWYDDAMAWMYKRLDEMGQLNHTSPS
jgi:hypothetical protein